MFAIWYPNAQGNPQPVPSFRGYPGGVGYSAHLFTKYMRHALTGMPTEKFPEAKDNGKIGGEDGKWGLGGNRRTSEYDYSDRASDNKEPYKENKDKVDRTENKPSDSAGAAAGDSSRGSEGSYGSGLGSGESGQSERNSSGAFDSPGSPYGYSGSETQEGAAGGD